MANVSVAPANTSTAQGAVYTPAPTIGAQATSAVATPAPTQTATTPVNGLTSAQQSLANNANIPAGQAGSPWSTSTTTATNVNPINAAPTIQKTTNDLVNGSGIQTQPNGTATYSNGTVYNPSLPVSPTNLPAGESYVNGQLTYTGQNANANNTVDPATGKTATGGYDSQGNYYAPGQVMTKDVNGNYPSLTATSPQYDSIMSNLQTTKSQVDSLSATLIDQITASYDALIKQQEQVNAGQQANTQSALLMGGVTGQGSSAQYAPISSAAILAGTISYGLSQVASLNAKKNEDIIKAQQAQADSDIKLQDEINTEIQNTQTQQQAALQKINDAVNAQAQKVAEEKNQQDKDSAVATLYNSGTTDPTAILNALKDKGMTVTLDEINTSLKAISPDKDAIANVALEAAKAGADASTMAKINAATTLKDAIAAASPALGQKAAQDLWYQQQQISLDRQRVGIEQQNANTAAQKLALDKSTAAQSAGNAVVTTPSGKIYVDGSSLDSAGKAAALNAGLTVLDGDSSKAMSTISNTLGQVNNLLSSLQAAGVDLTQTVKDEAMGTTTNKGATQGTLHTWAAGNATPALRNFAAALVGTGTSGTNGIITDLEKLPGTGQLVATLQNNIPKDTDSAKVMNDKITAITSALENTENSFLANANTPKEGETGTVDGVTYKFTNGNWVSQ